LAGLAAANTTIATIPATTFASQSLCLVQARRTAPFSSSKLLEKSSPSPRTRAAALIGGRR
jgi:hypothetical protein